MKSITIAIDKGTVIDRDNSRRTLGPVVLDLPEGPARCHDAISSTQITGQYPLDGEKFVAVISVAEFDGEHLGVLIKFSAESARLFGSSLFAAADAIDGGAKVS